MHIVSNSIFYFAIIFQGMNSKIDHFVFPIFSSTDNLIHPPLKINHLQMYALNICESMH